MPLPLGFIAPCLPTKAAHPPTGALWVHEIKHDGFRIIARKDGNRVRLYSRAGNVDGNGELSASIELRDHAAKKRSGRRIPLHPELRDALLAWRALNAPVGPVFVCKRPIVPLSVR